MVRSTIRDVADLAGVSIKTVSRVLNKERYVSPDTRARVLAAVDALSFHPSVAARSLGGRRSYQIALICNNPNPYYVFEVQLGLRDRAALDGVRLLAQPYDRDAPDLVGEVTALIDATHVDGLVLTPPVSDRGDVLDLLDARQIPIVRIQPGAAIDRTLSVAIDNVAAARAMTRRLIDLGHRRLGFIGGSADYPVSADRRTGYLAALGDEGIKLDGALLAEGDFTLAAGEAGAARLIAAGATAIFAASDVMAAGVLAEAHRRGLSLPRDLSVAGFDDSALAATVWPPLTTVRQPLRAIGWQAADLLLGTDAGDSRRVLDFEIIERSSTAMRCIG